MTKRHRRSLLNILAVGILLLIAFPIQFTRYTSLAAEPAAVLWTIRNAIQLTLMIAWGVSLKRRIVSPPIRRMLIAVAALLGFWLTVRLCKWEYTLGEMDTLGRYCWYGFYIPMTLVPLLGVFIVDHIGKPEGYRCPRWMMLLYIPAVLMIAGVFTNDLHRLAFDFPKGIEYYNRHYTYDVLYYIIMAWFVILGFYFVVMLMKKCRGPGSRSFQKLPLVIMICAVVFWTAYCLGMQECDLTAIDCFLITMLLESAIQGGLIPANSNYDLLFRMSTCPMQIVDQEGRVCYSSETAVSPSAQDMHRARTAPVHCGDTVLYSKPIRGGFLLWQDDVKQSNEVTEKLNGYRSQLSQNNQLLKAELELVSNRAKTQEMTLLYDRITSEVAPQLIKVDELLRQAKDGPLDCRGALTRISVISAYIKRRGNLILLSQQSQRVSAKELEYCLRESLDNLRLGGAYTSLSAAVSSEVPLSMIFAAYDLYEAAVERLYECITAVMIHLSHYRGGLRMLLQLGCDQPVSPEVLSDLQVSAGQLSVTAEEEDVTLELRLPEGGAGNADLE